MDYSTPKITVGFKGDRNPILEARRTLRQYQAELESGIAGYRESVDVWLKSRGK